MVITAIDHVQLAMPAGGEDAARGFYGNVLGLSEVPKPPILAKRGGAWFENNAVKVHVGVDPDFAPARKAHICFVVANLDEMSTRLTAADHTVRPNHEIQGTKRIFTDDPFGNRIEIMESV